MGYPATRSIEELMSSSTQMRVGDKFLPARSLGYPSLWSRFRCAWMVFTGRGDVLLWPDIRDIGRSPTDDPSSAGGT